jgi:predicted 3-demethylubiquinone-9 3-methyltransferase (glyoxalase superfamily)
MSILIEDPSDFDIWAKIRANDSLAFAEWLADRFGISKTDAFRVISPAVKGGKYVQVLSGYGWNSLRLW